MNWAAGTKETWATATGDEILIEELSDSHLINILRMLERTAEAASAQLVALGYSMLGSLQGEQAIYSVESDLLGLEENYGDPSYVHPQYDRLFAEFERRGLDIDELAPPKGE